MIAWSSGTDRGEVGGAGFFFWAGRDSVLCDSLREKRSRGESDRVQSMPESEYHKSSSL